MKTKHYQVFVKFLILNIFLAILDGNLNQKSQKMATMHPEGTSKNSDNYDFLKVSDIVKSIVVNGEKYF